MTEPTKERVNLADALAGLHEVYRPLTVAILLIEPKGTANTGDAAPSALTAPEQSS